MTASFSLNFFTFRLQVERYRSPIVSLAFIRWGSYVMLDFERISLDIIRYEADLLSLAVVLLQM